MLKLEPPKTQLRLDRGDTVGKRWERLQKRVREHPFNHAVSTLAWPPKKGGRPGILNFFFGLEKTSKT